MKVNVNFNVENVIQIKSVIKINIDVSIKNIINVEKDYIWNPAKFGCENGKYLVDIMDDSVIRCDEIIDADAESKSHDKAKSCGEETKAISTKFNEKSNLIFIIYKSKFIYFTCIFIDYHCIIDSC